MLNEYTTHTMYNLTYKLNIYYKIKIINHILILFYNFEFKQITKYSKNKIINTRTIKQK